MLLIDDGNGGNKCAVWKTNETAKNANDAKNEFRSRLSGGSCLIKSLDKNPGKGLTLDFTKSSYDSVPHLLQYILVVRFNLPDSQNYL